MAADLAEAQVEAALAGTRRLEQRPIEGETAAAVGGMIADVVTPVGVDEGNSTRRS